MAKNKEIEPFVDGSESAVEDTLKTEKVQEKVEKKNKKLSKPKKKCKVLSYIPGKFVIISFDGFGVRIDGVEDNPGVEVEVEYSGTIGTPDFKIEIV